MQIDVSKNIALMGAEIAAEFKRRIGDVRLTPDEVALVDRASARLATVAVLTPGADDATRNVLNIVKDAAIASVMNIGVAEGIRAEQVLRQVAFDVIVKSVGIVLALAA